MVARVLTREEFEVTAVPSRRKHRTVGSELTISRRNLPHWQMGGSTYLVTFRVKGASSLSVGERALVREAILSMHQRKWIVHLFTIMPDHVHILTIPIEKEPGRWFSLPEIMHGVKGRSAREINRMRSRTGELWQDEYFDRIIRNEKEFREKSEYILYNAVRAGLVEDPWEYDGFWMEQKDRSGEDTG